jgi:hypothetical protein
MVGGGGVKAQGTIAELEANDDPEVRAFFTRSAP